jgi:glycosyltransferase involved in cell wall biosynthesis
MDLCEGMSALGCEVHLAYAEARMDNNFRTRLGRLRDVRKVVIPMRSSIHPSDLSAARAVRRYIREAGPFDVVHGHSSKGGAVARLAAIGSGASVFYTMHGLVVIDGGLPLTKRAIYLAAELGLGLGTTRIVAVGPEEARKAVRLGLGRRKVVTIPNGVDAHAGRSREAGRRELGLADDAIAVGFVGRLVEQKAADVLIRAFALALPDAPTARLLMIGDGPLGEPLRALATQLGVNDRILWLGEQDATAYFSTMDVFAISSRKEGLPYVVLEAMAAGLPVVATRSAGVESLVIEGANGHPVPPDDAEAFGAALRKVLCDGRHRAAMGRGSASRVRQFSVTSMVAQTLDLYTNPQTFGCAPQPAAHTAPADGAIAVRP